MKNVYGHLMKMVRRNEVAWPFSAFSDYSECSAYALKRVRTNKPMWVVFYVEESPVIYFLSISTSAAIFRGRIRSRTFFSTSGVQYIFRSF